MLLKEAMDLINESVSKKHMEWAAKHVKSIVDPGERMKTADHFAHFFHAHNPRFDHDRFKKASGAHSGK